MDARVESICAGVATSAYKQLLPQEQALLKRFQSNKQIQSYVRDIVGNGGRISQASEQIGKILRLIEPVSQCFVNSIPGLYQPANFLWGIFGTVVHVINNEHEAMDFTLRMFDDLLTTLPRRNTYEHFIARSPDLQLAISDLYREFVRLGLRVMKTFGRGKVSILDRLKWKREQKEFQYGLRRLKHLKEKVDLEVGVASNERWERRYEEILNTRMPPAIEGVPLTSRHLEQSHNIFSIPYPRNAKFYGRQAVVDEIHQHLSHDRTTSSALKFVALCGLGGSGKTQLALEYAYKYRESYDACIWISCDTTIKAAQGFTDVARKLEVETAQQQQLMAVVKDWLCDSCENWLIIFDNAEDRKIVADLWPPTAHGSVLLTSQNQNWASADNLTRMMSIESFTHAEGVGMLQDILQDQEGGGIPTNAAERIVSIVGALPLAIFQLGSYLKATHSSPEEFIRRYQKPSKAARVDSWDEATPLTYQHTLATVWKLALERLPPDSMLLLNIFSFLDSDTVPDVLFLGGPEGSHFNDFDLFQDAIRYIRRYSLVVHVSGNGVIQGHVVHRQVKRYAQSLLDQNTFQRALDLLVRLLRHQFPRRPRFEEPFDPFAQEWQHAESWISHLMSINDALDAAPFEYNVSEELLSIFLDGSVYLWESGFPGQGRNLIAAAEKYSPVLDGNALSREIKNFSACILSDIGHFDEAEQLFQDCVSSEKKMMEQLRAVGAKATIDDEIRLANAYNNLAGIQCCQGRYEDAGLHNILSLELKQRWSETPNVNSLISLSYSNLGNLYGRQGRWDVSAEYFEKALGLGQSQSSVLRRALTAHNFGCMRLAQGEVELARQLLTKAYQLRSEKLGDHFETAGTMHMLSLCHFELGQLENAKDLLRDALRMLEAPRVPRDDIRIARSKYKLSVVLNALHDPHAQTLREDAIDLCDTLSSTSLTDNDIFDDLVAYT